jgi:hypothetical protein
MRRPHPWWYLAARIESTDPLPREPEERAILLAALLEACEARGWAVTLRAHPHGTSWATIDRLVTSTPGERLSVVCNAAPPLDALLPAYLEALRMAAGETKDGGSNG